VDLTGRMVGRCAMRTPRSTAKAVISQLRQAADRLADEAGISLDDIDQVVVGTPGVLRPGDDHLSLAPQLVGWESPKVIPAIREALVAPVIFENDVNMAAVGEHIQGVAQDSEDFVLLSVGTGVGAGVTYGRRLLVGARASWATATESSLVWTVTHDDYRLRAIAALQQPVGRGAFALRLGLGTTVVHEDRTRNQGARAHLTGADLSTSTTAALPAADLEAVVAVHVAGPWLFLVSGGPSALVSDGALVWGWTAQLGAGWQP